mmetsp:Transcript_24426/g.50715  ORF Transcript_24426/g.50715 Transcript_24426/m.50715 type:complete len:219 (+) Transcript_24426:2263-2919(+)
MSLRSLRPLRPPPCTIMLSTSPDITIFSHLFAIWATDTAVRMALLPAPLNTSLGEASAFGNRTAVTPSACGVPCRMLGSELDELRLVATLLIGPRVDALSMDGRRGRFLVPTGCTTVVVTLVWPAVASTMGGCVAAGASCFAVTTGAPGCTRAVELHDVPMVQGPTTRVRQRGGALGARVGVRATMRTDTLVVAENRGSLHPRHATRARVSQQQRTAD